MVLQSVAPLLLLPLKCSPPGPTQPPRRPGPTQPTLHIPCLFPITTNQLLLLLCQSLCVLQGGGRFLLLLLLVLPLQCVLRPYLIPVNSSRQPITQ